MVKYNSEKSKNLAEVKKMKKHDISNNITETQIAEMLKNKYDEVRKFKNFQYAAVKKWDKWWFVDRKWNEICDIIYDEVKDFEFEWYAPVKLNWKWGLATKQSRNWESSKFFLEFPCEYESLINMYDNSFAFKQNWKWGVMDINGEILIPCEYDEAHFYAWGHNTLTLIKKWKEFRINPRSNWDIKASMQKYIK